MTGSKSNILLFRPASELDGKRNLKAFVGFAKDQLTKYSECEDKDGNKGWDSIIWKGNYKSEVAQFVTYPDPTNQHVFESMPEPYISFARAYIRYNQSINPKKAIQRDMAGLRVVQKAIQDVYQKQNPCVLMLDGAVLSKVEEIVRNLEVSDGARYQIGGKVQRIYDFLRKEKINSTIPVWKNPFPRQIEKAMKTDEESRKWQEVRCPSMHLMLALADCFAKAETKKDKYFTSVLALLVFAPSRESELDSLTINSLMQDESGKWYVQWFGKKGMGVFQKWVPTLMVDTVKEAFKRLVEIGQPARNAAKIAFEYSGLFYRHEGCITPEDFPEDKPLSAVEFAGAMGFAQERRFDGFKLTWSQLPQKWIKNLLAQGDISYKVLATYSLEKYKTHSWPNCPNSDSLIWESLLLTRENEYHDDFEPRGFSWGIPSVNEINHQITKRKGVKQSTLWERFGIKDEDGSEAELTTHQLRVWLNTVAQRGGMDEYLLAQWSGRADISQNKAYDLRTQEEKAERMNALMALDHERRPKILEARKLNIPVAYEDFGIARVGIADVTWAGFCLHDFAESPCTKNGECITCKEHACVKGLPKTLERLEQLEEQLTPQFEKAQEEAKDGTFGADRWITYLGWKLAHVRTLLVALKSDKVQDGTILRVPKGHDPSPTRRAMMGKGMDVETEEEKRLDKALIKKILG
ncbi:MAG: hypothetical protein PF450_07720 [Bacteroidales bacterium]|jgi:hypothetical protein|nr:hypothetical protein [Bacteroidales bacterium]